MITRRTRNLALFGVTLLALPYAAQATIDTTSENVSRLDMQGHIDDRAPFSKTVWAGAHNAYASFQWDDGTYTDVNQWYSPKSLLERGIRTMEYDVYPRYFGDSTPYLCHLGGSEDTNCYFTAFATFEDGLEEIRDFIETNRDEVVLLKLEIYQATDHDNWGNKIGDEIEDTLGDMVFQPQDWGYASDNCGSLPVQALTKQNVLDAGRNVVIMTQTPRDQSDLCDYWEDRSTGSLLDNVWIGVDEMDYEGDLTQFQVLAQNSDDLTPDASGTSSATTHYENGNFSVRLDATTEYGCEGGDDLVEGEEIVESAVEGYHLLELALVEGEGTGQVGLGEGHGVLIEDYVWSWDDGEPSGSGPCARSNSHDRIGDRDCSTNDAYACVDEDRSWTVVTPKGVWADGFDVCAAEGLSFGMPYNALENADLALAKDDAGVTAAWVNYYEPIDGYWLANQDPDVTLSTTTTIAAVGSTEMGDAFDDIDLVKRRYATDGRLVVSSIVLGENSDDGYLGYMNWCYTQTQSVSPVEAGNEICRTHGVSESSSLNTSLTLDYDGGEFIEKARVCMTGDSGEERIVYLKLTTNEGRTVSRGEETGKCYNKGSVGKQLFGTTGRSTEIEVLGWGLGYIWGLGFYRIDEVVSAPIYASDWLDRDNPTGQADNELFAGHQSDGKISSSCVASDLVGQVARVKDTLLASNLTGQVLVDDETGFACWNSDNGGSSSSPTCEEYEVRYFFSDPTCIP